jgi:O-antigen ligase
LKVALTISQSVDPASPRWNSAKAQIVQWTRDAVGINPHYRKLTPSIADALAGWGDWNDADWIWKSVAASRPNIAAIQANLARGQMHLGDFAASAGYLQRANELQPNAPLMKTLAVLLSIKTGQIKEAIALAKSALSSGQYDNELLRLSYLLGLQHGDTELSILALELRIKKWPTQSVDAWLKLGDIYDTMRPKNPEKAMQSYNNAVTAGNPANRTGILAEVPSAYRAKIR